MGSDFYRPVWFDRVNVLKGAVQGFVMGALVSVAILIEGLNSAWISDWAAALGTVFGCTLVGAGLAAVYPVLTRPVGAFAVGALLGGPIFGGYAFLAADFGGHRGMITLMFVVGAMLGGFFMYFMSPANDRT